MSDGAERLKPPTTSEDALDRDRGEQDRAMSAEVHEQLLTLAGTAEQAAILEKAVSLFGELPVPERPGRRLASAVEALPGDLRTSIEMAHLARSELANELLERSNRIWLAGTLKGAGREHLAAWRPLVGSDDDPRLVAGEIRRLRDWLREHRSDLPEDLDPLAFDGIDRWLSAWTAHAAIELVIETNWSTIDRAIAGGLNSFQRNLGTSLVDDLKGQAWQKVPRVIEKLEGVSIGQLHNAVRMMALNIGRTAYRAAVPTVREDPNDLMAQREDGEDPTRIAEATDDQQRWNELVSSMLEMLEDAASHLQANVGDSALVPPQVPHYLLSPELLSRPAGKVSSAAEEAVAAALATLRQLMKQLHDGVMDQVPDVAARLSSIVHECYAEIHIRGGGSPKARFVEARRNEPAVVFALHAVVARASSARRGHESATSVEAQAAAYSLERLLCAYELEVIASRLATTANDFSVVRCQAFLDRARELISELERTLNDLSVGEDPEPIAGLVLAIHGRFAAAIDRFEVQSEGKLFGEEPPPIDRHQAVLADGDPSARDRARPELADTLYRELMVSTAAQPTDRSDPRQRLAGLGAGLTDRFARLSAVRCWTEANWAETTLEALPNVDGWVEAARRSLDGLHRSLSQDALKAAEDAELIEGNASSTLIAFCQRLAALQEAPPHLRRRATAILELRGTLQTFIDANARTSEEKD